ncbi:MAG: hypothetical protein ACREFO_19405 [Acetobacteraceae bacterium]
MRIYMHNGTDEGPAIYIDTVDGGVHLARSRKKEPEWGSVAQAIRVLKAAIRIKEPTVRAQAIKSVAGFVAEELRGEIGETGIVVVG